MLKSIFNAFVPSRNLNQEFDKEADNFPPSHEHRVRESVFLSSIKNDTLLFVSSEALSGKVIYQNAIFTKMEQMVDEGGFEDITEVKISYFFDTIYTLALQAVSFSKDTSTNIDTEDSYLSLKEKRNLKDRIKRAIEKAKYILLESFSIYLKSTEGQNNLNDINVSPYQAKRLPDKSEVINDLLLKLKGKIICKEDFLQLKKSNVCTLCSKHLEEYDEEDYIRMKAKKEKDNAQRSKNSPNRLHNLAGKNSKTCVATVITPEEAKENYIDERQDRNEEDEGKRMMKEKEKKKVEMKKKMKMEKMK
jgi:hypothetical protein